MSVFPQLLNSSFKEIAFYSICKTSLHPPRFDLALAFTRDISSQEKSDLAHIMLGSLVIFRTAHIQASRSAVHHCPLCALRFFLAIVAGWLFPLLQVTVVSQES